MFSSLKVRDFRIYWLGMVVSLTGTWIQAVAQSWLVFKITNSVFLLGLVGFLTYIPIFLLSLFGGVIADRIDKRIILIFTQTVFMLLAFFLAILTQFNLIKVHEIMLIALLNGAIMAFDAPARQALVVELVGKEKLLNAVALNSMAFNSSRIIGPAVAGLLVSTIGMAGCFYINGLSFMAMIIALFLIKNERHILEIKGTRAFMDLKEGLSFVKYNRLILTLISIVGIVSLFGSGYVILMPVFANDILKTGVQGLGMLMSSSGLGALIGTLILARLGEFRFKGGLLLFSSFIFSLSLMLFALSKIYILSILTLLLVGCSSVIAIALVNTLLQTEVPDRFRGRVMGVFMVTFTGMMPFGNLLAGMLSGVLSVPRVIFLSGIITLMVLLGINILRPEIKKV